MYRLSCITALLFVSVPAYSSSCVPITVCSSFEQSTIVFRGRVVAIDSTFAPPVPIAYPDGSKVLTYSGQGTDKVRFEVLEIFKGNPVQQISVSATQALFKQDGEYLVFANAANSEFFAGVCSPTRALTNSHEDADLAWLRTAPETATIFGKLSIVDHADEKVAGSIALSGNGSRSATSDEKNLYTFKNLAPGTYIVTASVPDGMLTDSPQTVTIAARGCAEVDWYLKYDSHIQGTVTDSSGKPLSGVPVAVLKPEANRVGFRQVGQQRTNEHGAYDISKVAPGDYWLALYPHAPSRTDPYVPVFYPSGSTLSEAQLLHLPASGTLANLNLILPAPLRTAVVHAHVIHQDGTPVDQAQLIAIDATSNLGLTFFDATADAGGQADLTLYAGQEYSLTADTPGEQQPPSAGPVKFTAQDGMVLDPLICTEHMRVPIQ